jgi:hypothetical protein
MLRYGECGRGDRQEVQVERKELLESRVDVPQLLERRLQLVWSWIVIAETERFVQHTEEREVRDVAAIRLATALEHGDGVRVYGAAELVEQSALAKARIADDRHKLAPATHGLVQSVTQRRKLGLTPGVCRQVNFVRRLEPALRSRFPKQAMWYSLHTTFERYRLALLRFEERSKQPLALSAHEDLAYLCFRGDSTGSLQRISHDAIPLIARRMCLCDHQTHIDAGLKLDTFIEAELSAQFHTAELRMKLDSGSGGAHDIVFVGGGDAEHGDDLFT